MQTRYECCSITSEILTFFVLYQQSANTLHTLLNHFLHSERATAYCLYCYTSIMLVVYIRGWQPFAFAGIRTIARMDTIPKDTIPNGHHSEWAPSLMDTIQNGYHPEWTLSRMDTIPNVHYPEWTLSRMDTIPNGHHPEWTLSRKDTIPNGHHPEWTPSQMNSIQNGHNPEWTQSRMDAIQNGHHPE